jgi:hypothetical protein
MVLIHTPECPVLVVKTAPASSLAGCGCTNCGFHPSAQTRSLSAPGPSFLRVPAVPAYFPPCAGAHPDPAVTTNPVLETNTASPAAPQPTHPLIPTIRAE